MLSCLCIRRAARDVGNMTEEQNVTMSIDGDVTQLLHLIGKSLSQLEASLGYESGRLKPGWSLDPGL
jgi:hypothetical protein